jgi:hypothetical protein
LVGYGELVGVLVGVFVAVLVGVGEGVIVGVGVVVGVFVAGMAVGSTAGTQVMITIRRALHPGSYTEFMMSELGYTLSLVSPNHPA